MGRVLGEIVDYVRGRDGRAWSGSVERLLYEGERVRETVDVDGNRVVVTTHRVLAFTPDSDGENFQQVDLPNVTDVRPDHEGERNLLGLGGRMALYGVVLLAVGVFVDFGSFVPTDAFDGTGEAGGQIGVGGLLGMMGRFMELIARADEFARVAGVVLVLFATFVFGVYFLTRDRVLAVETAGDDADVHVPVPDADEEVEAAVDALESELFESGPESPSGESRPGQASESDPLGESTAGADSSADAGFKSDDAL